MVGQHVYFHSPFSLSTASEGEGPSLILQFILKELIRAEGYLSKEAPPLLAPFDWSWKQGSHYKVSEHASLLSAAFPSLAAEAQKFLRHLDKPCHQLMELLEPFVLACQTNENLLLFLLKHRNFLNIESILNKICPEGPEKLKLMVADQYQKRGFYTPEWINSSATL